MLNINKKPFSPAHKKIVTVWIIALVTYVAFTLFTALSFEWLTLSIISNIILIPLILIQSKQQEVDAKVEDAVKHLQLINGKIVIGKNQLLVEKVNKVVLDVQDDLTHCSFPFNHIQAGVIINFCFPKEQTEALKKHIQKVLPTVKIIEERST